MSALTQVSQWMLVFVLSDKSAAAGAGLRSVSRVKFSGVQQQQLSESSLASTPPVWAQKLQKRTSLPLRNSQAAYGLKECRGVILCMRLLFSWAGGCAKLRSLASRLPDPRYAVTPSRWKWPLAHEAFSNCSTREGPTHSFDTNTVIHAAAPLYFGFRSCPVEAVHDEPNCHRHVRTGWGPATPQNTPWTQTRPRSNQILPGCSAPMSRFPLRSCIACRSSVVSKQAFGHSQDGKHQSSGAFQVFEQDCSRQGPRTVWWKGAESSSSCQRRW